ncbi:MAG: cyclic nucleotide-binding domain-containing protein [Sandaracinus sp.]|nr:cyclic nucleotide-binding domain-containing protein [Myxococcales bacterium]MCB9599900.1 cyclic nucleotide-binding domain-containing protein [Sandaracinus sp.]MCB9624030.1 cyclic nucleotide-binding domain-containing protein [Sandaracinus sp.]
MSSQEQERPRPRITADILRDIGLFGGLDDESLTVLARELPTRVVEVGQTVVEEGDLSREMFVVVGGELEVVKRGPRGGEFRVALFGPGDWFGEMSILDVQPRSATVRAVAPTMLVTLSSEHVEKLLYRRDLKAYALLLMNIARELSRRLRVADGILGQFVSSVSDTYTTSKPGK